VELFAHRHNVEKYSFILCIIHISLKKESKKLKWAKVVNKIEKVNYIYLPIGCVPCSVKSDKKAQKRRAEHLFGDKKSKFNLLFVRQKGLSSEKMLIFTQKTTFTSNSA